MAQLLDIKSSALQELEAEVAVKRERMAVGWAGRGRARRGVARAVVSLGGGRWLCTGAPCWRGQAEEGALAGQHGQACGSCRHLCHSIVSSTPNRLALSMRRLPCTRCAVLVEPEAPPQSTHPTPTRRSWSSTCQRRARVQRRGAAARTRCRARRSRSGCSCRSGRPASRTCPAAWRSWCRRWPCAHRWDGAGPRRAAFRLQAAMAPSAAQGWVWGGQGRALPLPFAVCSMHTCALCTQQTWAC